MSTTPRDSGAAAIRIWSAFIVLCLAPSIAPAADPEPEVADLAGVPGGLCVIVGDQAKLAADLVRSGKYLTIMLAPESKVDAARASLAAWGHYGPATVREAPQPPPRVSTAPLEVFRRHLPFAENLVNLVIVDDLRQSGLWVDEIMRVLCPNGVAMLGKAGTREEIRRLMDDAGVTDFQAAGTDGPWVRVRKPFPPGTDGWTHPRYDASSNPVSNDILAGPPGRIRWVIGPPVGSNNMVTAGGRCFYGNVIARDAYNGLMLWSRPLQTGGVPPVLSDELLFAVHDRKLLGLDPATGKTLRTYAEAGEPLEVLHADGTLVMLNHTTVRAISAETGQRLWSRGASTPGCLAVGDGTVFYVNGNPRRGEKCSILAIDLATGAVRWQKTMRLHRGEPDDYEWLPQATRCSYQAGRLALEVSTWTDFPEGNAIHVLSAADGKHLWSRAFAPHGAHRKQARALFADGTIWIVENGKIEGLDPATGETKSKLSGGSGHCYPPVATKRYIWSGEMSVTDLQSGSLVENRITKGSCSITAGVIPANGLVYTFPKGCVCWPMLKGFAALAPAITTPSGAGAVSMLSDRPILEPGPAKAPAGAAGADPDRDWPAYRHDALRSNATTGRVPTRLAVRWRRPIASTKRPRRPRDWDDNPFNPGIITPPVVAGDVAVVAVCDQHRVDAVDAHTGEPRWQFIADGRIDSAPTLTRGLCLFGTRNGWVYCLRAADGKLVWRLRATHPDEPRIIAYGQVESPWPIAGSVLVEGDTAWFAAGRQFLADGGIRVFAVDPETGKVRWTKRVWQLTPDFHFYAAAALEFDDFDLLVREGTKVSMSRWRFEAASGEMDIVPKSGFYRTGEAGVMAPRGCWSYGPRAGRGAPGRKLKRPPVAFRDNVLVSCTDERDGLFRRDFRLDAG
ncbi:MAG TPA: PQQ-binding-like beta-propeller repeat protein, partial [Phycisphaerae bacterium]|nr:PQQ-binding-like beta-propeller repeat protein [Phycisphaerae bacterium]